MLNAIYLSEIFGAEFRFFWPERKGRRAAGHAIRPLESMFSKKFIDRYHSSEFEIKSLPIYDFENYNSRSLEIDPDAEVLINVGPGALEKNTGRLRDLKLDSPDHEALFKKIRFADDLERARQLGENSIERGEYVALHVRAGDIVYGGFRYSDEYNSKVIPISLFEPIIKELRRDGYKALLFGQDLLLQRLLAERTGAELSQDYIKGVLGSDEETAIIDLQMMSRCARIYGGSSGFNILASWIGSIPRLNYNSLFNIDKVLELTDLFLADPGLSTVDRLQLAFLCRTACLVAGEGIPTTPRFTSLNERALRLDPDNAYYYLIKAASLMACGDRNTGDLILLEAFRKLADNKLVADSFRSLRTDSRRGSMLDMNHEFKKSADAGLPIAALCTSIRYYYKSDLDCSRKYYAIHAASIRPDHGEICKTVASRLISFGPALPQVYPF